MTLRGAIPAELRFRRGRGTLIEPQDGSPARVLLTVHPSYLLRVLPETRAAEYAKFVEDLKIAANYIRKRG